MRRKLAWGGLVVAAVLLNLAVEARWPSRAGVPVAVGPVRQVGEVSVWSYQSGPSRSYSVNLGEWGVQRWPGK